jgi:hypothetical protein
MLTQAELNLLFSYADGKLVWKNRYGKRAGSCGGMRYRQVNIRGKYYREHRIIWTMVNGDIPEGFCIDHINGNSFDNRIDNLRLATHNQNCFNRKMHKNNMGGHKCIGWHQASQTWRVKVMAMGKVKHKHYSSLELAKEGYKQLVVQLHGDFAKVS